MIDALAVLSGMPDPAQVRAMEAHLLTLPQVDVQTQLLVHGRMCARTILVPAGTMLTGVQTNCDNVCILCGDITVTTDAGPQRLTGFHVLPAAAGFKRAGIAHADTWWATVHHTDHTDPALIEREMTDEPGLLQTRQAVITTECATALEGA